MGELHIFQLADDPRQPRLTVPDGYSDGMANFPKASHRVRRLAYEDADLDLAVRARNALMPRRKLRPYSMIERKRSTTATSRFILNRADTSSFARQTAYTNDGGKIARRSLRAVGGGGGGFTGGGGPGGGGGGGWPF